jgi:GNAT superfamily N-acetyltransferase
MLMGSNTSWPMLCGDSDILIEPNMSRTMTQSSQVELARPSFIESADTAKRCALRDEVRKSDRDAIRSLVERTEFFHAEEVDIAIELVDERLERGAASGYEFVLAETGGELVGYACYGPIACTKGSYDLYWIAVDTRYQRHGIGRLLLQEVELQVARHGGRRIYVDTSGRGQYSPTRAFYERSGFACEARLRDFYAPSDDRVIYGKAVDPGRP